MFYRIKNLYLILTLPFLCSCQSISYKPINYKSIITKNQLDDPEISSRIWVHPAYSQNNNSQGELVSIVKTELNQGEKP